MNDKPVVDKMTSTGIFRLKAKRYESEWFVSINDRFLEMILPESQRTGYPVVSLTIEEAKDLAENIIQFAEQLGNNSESED